MKDASRSPGSQLALFSLDSGRPLLARVCKHLSCTPALHEERAFEDGEHKARPLESVRGRDVYIVQSLFGDEQLSVNDKLVRTLFFIAALRDAGSARVTAIIPYLSYARKDVRTKPRDPVTSRYIAALFEAVGTDRVVVLDVHNPAAYENAFRIPAESLTARQSLVEACRKHIADAQVVVVSPDAGGVKRAERFRQQLEQRSNRPVGFAFLEKFRSEGAVRGGGLAGDVADKVAIIVDDLISSGTTLARAASLCRARGARSALAAVTHGVFAKDADRVLGDSDLERIFVTDSVEPRAFKPALERRLEVLECAPLLASAIQRLHNHGSLSELGES